MKLNLLALGILAGFGLCQGSTEQPEVTISQGKVKGLFLETFNLRKISAFLGIPYAKPPVGKLRFEEPVPASPWPGVINGTIIPNHCIQYSHVDYLSKKPVTGEEDCLYINVYTPKVKGDFKKDLLEVVVNIHGGAFMFYYGTDYRPEYLLDRDVLLVTFNYRLGSLGFLSTEDMVVPGNNGLKDQLLALKWVQNNIEAFGGNPKKVTITGMSAGGSSVHYHVLSPKSKGLFRGAISMSGTSLCHWSQTEHPKEKAETLAHQLGCPTSDTRSMVNCLKTRPAYNIVSLTHLFMPYLYNPFTPFGPVVEPVHKSAFIDRFPSEIIKNKKANDVPLLLSFTADEGLYPGAEILNDSARMDHLIENWNENIPHLLDFNYTIPLHKHAAVSEEIKKYFMREDSIKDNKKAFIKMISERTYTIAIAQTAKLHASLYKSPVHVYKFSYAGRHRVSDFLMDHDVYEGACHGDDLQYILRNSDLNIIKGNDYAILLSKCLIDIWMTFIKGNPFPSNWRPVKESLPNFGYLDISGADPMQDTFVNELDFASESFWSKINFNEDNGINRIKHDEL